MTYLSPLWGFGRISLPMCYTPIAPLGLFRPGKSKKISTESLRNRDRREQVCDRGGPTYGHKGQFDRTVYH